MFSLQISSLLLTTSGVFALISSTGAALSTLNKECGDIVCSEHTYCSQVDHICRPCDNICNPDLGNYDANRCHKDCQDYLHDELYAKKAVVSAIDSVQHELLILKILVIASLGLTGIVLILLAALTFKVYRQSSRCGSASSVSTTARKPPAELPAVIYNNKYERTSTPVRKSVENNNMRNRDRDRDSREPSESTLPEYSYDNPTMLPSPSHHV